MPDPNSNSRAHAAVHSDPLLRLRLRDGAPATLRLAVASTVLAIAELRVSSYDLSGRPFALVRDGWTWRRALDGRLLQKGGRPGEPRVRRLVPADQATPVVEGARSEARAVLEAVEAAQDLDPAVRHEARRRLKRIVAMNDTELGEDAARFTSIYRPVGMLPPDQYLALVVQATEGCSWNACTFCDLYRGTPFRVKAATELEAHAAAIRDFFGESLALRRTLFLADANALCISHKRLLELLDVLAAEFPVAPFELSGRALRSWLEKEPWGVSGIYSFVDAWTGHRKAVEDYRQYAERGLRRVYVGLETGDSKLLEWLQKPGAPSDAVELVHTLHEARVSAGVIVLLGVGGEQFFDVHVRGTAKVLSEMRLGREDLVYFSELVEHSGLEYAARAQAQDVRPLDPDRCAEQRRAILAAFRPGDPASPPRTATYDIREFIY
jgi:hypothetical protein